MEVDRCLPLSGHCWSQNQHKMVDFWKAMKVGRITISATSGAIVGNTALSFNLGHIFY